MSCRRSDESLCGTHSLTDDALAQVGLERIAGHQVDLPSQQLLETATQAHELEEGHWAVELHEDIDIAVGAQLPARSRAEHPETAHRVRVQFLEMASQNSKDLGRVAHGVVMPIVAPAPKRGSLTIRHRSGGANRLLRPPNLLPY